MPGIAPTYKIWADTSRFPDFGGLVDQKLGRAIDDLGNTERSKRQDEIDLRWAYYDGNHPKPLKVEPKDRDDNIILNLCGRAADKTVEFIGIPQSIVLPGGVDNVQGADGALTETRTDQQKQLDAFWEFNDLHEFMQDSELSGLIAGHTFWRLFRTEDPMPMLALLDPRMVTAYWNANNVRETLFFRLQWKVGSDVYRQDIVPNWLLAGFRSALAVRDDQGDGTFVEAPTGWTILEFQQSKGRAKWELVAVDEWEDEFAPIYEYKNKRRPHEWYGVSDFQGGAIAINNGINFTASNIGRILKFHAHPRTIGIGVDAEEIVETRIDGFYTTQNAEAKINNLEMQSDLSSSLNFLSLLRAEFFSTLRVVDVASVKDKLGQITNFGVRMLFSDMLDMIESKRDVLKPAIAEISRRGLWLGGVQMDERPTVTFGDPLPVNRLEQLQAAQLERTVIGTSQQTLAEEAGRDYPAEQAKKAEEQADANEALANTLINLGDRGLMNEPAAARAPNA